MTTFDYFDKLPFRHDSTLLNRGNYSIPGYGVQPDYCCTPFISHLKGDGSGAVEMYITCKLARCPSCYHSWIDGQVFDNAVKIEAYARSVRSRPARVVGSISRDRVLEGLTLDDIRNFKRNSKDRLKRCGVSAAVSVEHAFRLKDGVKKAIRSIVGMRGGKLSSGAFWSFLRDSNNIKTINAFLGTDYQSWRGCVDLSPHMHYVTFPGNQKVTGDKDVLLTKLSSLRGDKKIWVLESVDDVVSHLRYLIGHCGILVNSGKCRNQPVNVMGDLYGFNPEDYLSPEEVDKIRSDVLDVLNKNRDTPLVVGNDGNLTYEHEDHEDQPLDSYLPMSSFVRYSALSDECVDAWLAGIDDVNNRAYCEYLVSLYNDIFDDPDVPSKKRRLFTSDLMDPPDSFFILRLGGGSDG